jgi:uncharacterized membrane protein YsdA (DUF1294 family)
MTPPLLHIVAVYLLSVNVIAFAAFGIDKRKARFQRWRISEAALLSLSALGGWLGAFAGMKVFHHKTRKTKFTLGVPLTAAVWIAAGVLLLRFG